MVPRKGKGPGSDRCKVQNSGIVGRDKTGLKDRWY